MEILWLRSYIFVYVNLFFLNIPWKCSSSIICLRIKTSAIHSQIRISYGFRPEFNLIFHGCIEWYLILIRYCVFYQILGMSHLGHKFVPIFFRGITYTKISFTTTLDHRKRMLGSNQQKWQQKISSTLIKSNVWHSVVCNSCNCASYMKVLSTSVSLWIRFLVRTVLNNCIVGPTQWPCTCTHIVYRKPLQ